MQIDTARCTPLSQGENDRHCQEWFYYYYGSSKQKLPKCPIRLKNLRARTIISMENGALENKDAWL